MNKEAGLCRATPGTAAEIQVAIPKFQGLSDSSFGPRSAFCNRAPAEAIALFWP